MNPVFYRMIKDINEMKKKEKEKVIKSKPKIIKNGSVENFIKFQWVWTM